MLPSQLPNCLSGYAPHRFGVAVAFVADRFCHLCHDFFNTGGVRVIYRLNQRQCRVILVTHYHSRGCAQVMSGGIFQHRFRINELIAVFKNAHGSGFGDRGLAAA